MAEVFRLAFGEMVGFLFFFAIGVLLGRLKLLPEQAGASFSRLITYVFLPAMVFNSFAQQCTMEKLVGYAQLLAAGAALLALCLPVSIWMRRKFRGEQIERVTASYSMVIPNFGYLGYPLVLALFGQETLAKFMMFGLPFHIYIYGYAMRQWMPGTGKSGSAWLRVLNAPTIALVLGVLLGVSGLQSPAFVSKVTQSASACMSPCAMIATGLAIGRIPLKQLFGDKRVYWIAGLRLIILPAIYGTIAFFLCRWLKLEPDILRIAGVFLALPLGINPVVFAQAYDQDGSFAAECALMSMLISLVTLPALLSLVSQLALIV